MSGMIEPHFGKCLGRIESGSAEEIPPERKIFRYAQRRLEGIAMSEIMGLLGQGQLRVAAFESDRSSERRQKARNQAQQRGLARSVWADYRERFPLGHLEIEARKNLPATPHTADLAPQEPHLAPSRPSEIQVPPHQMFTGSALLQNPYRCG